MVHQMLNGMQARYEGALNEMTESCEQRRCSVSRVFHTHCLHSQLNSTSALLIASVHGVYTIFILYLCIKYMIAVDAFKDGITTLDTKVKEVDTQLNSVAWVKDLK